MKPTIRKLPKSVQSIICASNQINSYTKAVQELVFNSLDADATSIAVRINIAEGSIQVVDNGCGISKVDFKYIGQNYMTSKLVDISTLKSAPNKYGFQGQSLANLAQISENLKVTSRFNQCETTFVKTFENGTEKLTTKCSPRPSKGTTIEIKGFLYNLSIQRKSVDLLNELQNIKAFLEYISLVHPRISLSLRDDSKNEIVYKIHKNRDMYQTLSTLYEIEKSYVQELQVEKNEYKVKAYVGKRDVEMNRHLIFLNGKCIHDSSLLHKKVNDNFKKHLKGEKKIINKNVNTDEQIIPITNLVPFYFMFITCPYMDYELTKTVLEFKDWGQINTLLEKLVKFYVGDMQLKSAPEKPFKKLNNKQETEWTRNHIENIMRKILGSHSKKPEISQMQNGIKGKLIKRKPKTKKLMSSLKEVESKKEKRKERFSHKQKQSKTNSSDQHTVHEPRANKDGSNRKILTELGKISKRKRNCLTTSSNTLDSKSNKNKLQKKPYPKNVVSSKVNIKKHMDGNTHVTKTKQSAKLCFKKKISLNDKFAMETESVKRRMCELLAEQTKELIKNKTSNSEVFRNEHVRYINSNFNQNNKNIAIQQKVSEIVIHEYLPLPPKNHADHHCENSLDNKLFKSNYDLLKTIISSQKSGRDKQRENINAHFIPAIDIPYSRMSIDKNFRDISSPLAKSTNQAVTPHVNRLPLIRELDDSLFQTEMHESTNLPQLVRHSDHSSPFQAATFMSHNYGDQDYNIRTERDERNNCHNKQRNFITTQSRKNFMLQSNVPNKHFFLKNKSNFGYFKQYQPSNRNLKKLINLFDRRHNTIKGIESSQESYTIEFTDCNHISMTNNVNSKNNMVYSVGSKSNKTLTPSLSYFCYEPSYACVSSERLTSGDVSDNHIIDLDYEPINRNTFTISNLHRENSIQDYFIEDNFNRGTYTIDKTKEENTSSCEYETLNNYNLTKRTIDDASNSTNFVFVSQSQKNIDDKLFTNPIDICETVMNDQELSISRVTEFDDSFNYRYTNEMCDDIHKLNRNTNVVGTHSSNINENAKNVHVTLKNQQYNQNQLDEISHHFPNIHTSVCKTPIIIDPVPEAHDNIASNNQNKDDTANKNNNLQDFNIRNRLCFVPKGMSPLFEECQSKPDYRYDLTEDCYTDKMYVNFIEKVQNNAEIFKPRIRETGDLTTKDISKVNNKRNKDNASLKFDGKSIRNATVLGQVDRKYIAAILKGNDHKSLDSDQCLVLFDQHAVHERIRLENNLADYLNGSQWKSVTIDEFRLKISRDDILYLHNYGDKFTQLGLEWTISNYHEISITAIPEAILGKNPRQVDKIMKAVRNLITEEILIIQMQRGCISLHPKSIMDLVFSEACRYAIKFGERLSKNQCVEMLKALSDCKTPFQCAHGRPDMAVITNIESNNFEYKINIDELKQFQKKFSVIKKHN